MTEVEPRFRLEKGSSREGVMKGWDLKRNRRVAVKFALSNLARKETEIYEQLGHGPGIPVIYGRRIHATSTHGYFCMEEFEQDLFDVVSTDGPMSLGFACGVARTILGVLSRAHSKGIIHRDIKPDNIVCSGFDGLELEKLAVIDWGLAVDVNKESDSATRFAGTPAFMSVSCLHGNAPHALDDLESLLYLVEFLIAEDPPWSNSEKFEELARVKESWVPENPSLREFLIYVRDRGSGHLPNYDYLDRLLEAAVDINISL